MKNQKGITLIALVITIIVLLILAGVSISMVLGENGVLSQANKSKTETEISSEKEMVGLAYSGLNSEVLIGNKEKVTASELEEEINRLYGEEKVTVTEGSNMLIVKFNISLREYILDNKGNINDGFANSLSKHPEQVESEYIGIAEDGTIVNMDLWTCSFVNSGSCVLGTEGSGPMSGYDNNDIVDGMIQGKVPMYIKKDNENIYVVNKVIFKGCTNLVVSPELPSSVTNMNYSFKGCTNLTTVTNIPDSVTELIYAFSGCTNLVVLPKIPSTVTNMTYTFENCKNLMEVSEIPSSVENMRYTFKYCTNLTGTLKINANPTSYTNCLLNAATAEGCNLILVGNGSNDDAITNIYNTKSDTSNITIGSDT